MRHKTVTACFTLSPIYEKALILSLAFSLTACDLLAPNAKDLRIVSVRGYSRTSSLARSGAWPPSIFPLIEVTFTTSTDFGALSKDGWSISIRAERCNTTKGNASERILGDPFIYDRHGALGTFRQAGSSRLGSERSAPIAYHVYLVPQNLGTWKYLPRYSLVRAPGDVCLRIGSLYEGIPIISEILPMPSSRTILVLSKSNLIMALKQVNL
jgi:hypothetical protein